MGEEKLIQSQQVTLTGRSWIIRKLLTDLKLEDDLWSVTVTLTPTSVPDATVGVIRESQQNPQQPERCGECVIHLIAGASYFPCALPKGHAGGHRGSGTCFTHGDYLGKEGAVPECPGWPTCVGIHADAQSSVTEQSQQKSRQDGEA